MTAPTSIHIDSHSALCSLGPRPIIMTGALRWLLIDHFSNGGNIEHSELTERLWTDDQETKIRIEDSTVWTPLIADKTPSIMIHRNGWEQQKRVLGNTGGYTREGNLCQVAFWRGSHTIFCLAKEGAEAEILGAETYRFLLHFSSVIRKTFGLLAFELVSVGPLSLVEEERECYAVPITVAYGWEEHWVVVEHAPRLKTIQLSLLLPQPH